MPVLRFWSLRLVESHATSERSDLRAACGLGHGLVEKRTEATESDQDSENHKDVGQVGAYYCEQPRAALPWLLLREVTIDCCVDISQLNAKTLTSFSESVTGQRKHRAATHQLLHSFASVLLFATLQPRRGMPTTKHVTLSEADGGSVAVLDSCYIAHAQSSTIFALYPLSFTASAALVSTPRDTNKEGNLELPNVETPVPPPKRLKRLQSNSCRSQHCMRHRGLPRRRLHPTCPWSTRTSKRYSMTALYLSMNANPRELEIEDDLARAQKVLRDLKSKISSQSKKNFVLEKDVRYLDSRIALLVQNRMALEERNEVADHLDESDELTEGAFPNDDKTQKYGNLLFLLQSEPKHIAHLCRLVTLAEIDQLLQTVMFTIYGNQYESREEHLLLTMFQSVLTYQFDNTPDYSSLLRANTPVSRMMTTYTRRGPGQGYLKTVLSEQINYVTSKLRDVDLEINPLKVYETMMSERASIRGSTSSLPPGGITAEEAAANPQVQAIISRRVGQLIQLANYFLDTIVNGMDETPYGIRWICKQIRSLSRRKYPDAQDQTICTLIGGFFFLRFINPAIVTPRSYMLIEQNPAENPKRTLTLVAKMLQNLANKPSYAKEPYMSVLQPFIQQNKERMNKFLLDLCEVQDFYETLEMDNYVALSKKDLELPISLNEVYAMHALLEKHTQELVARDEGSHLKILLQDLGPAPAQLPRKENRAINLPLYSKWETALDDLTAALDITQEEVYFMEAKSTFVMILRSLPANAVVARRPLRLDRVAEAAATTKNDSVMVRKGIRSMELLSQLNDMGMIDKADNYASLRDEVEQELNHLGSLKDRVMTESQKLEEVYQTIRDHNAYLVGQLETYKSYLHNVRGHWRRKASSRREHLSFHCITRYAGRNRGLLELDLKLDDLLEMQKDSQEDLDLEYVQFNVSKLLVHLNKKFARKRGW
ncbi:ras GTPase activator, partial [Aureobasidium melanogenum]